MFDNAINRWHRRKNEETREIKEVPYITSDGKDQTI